MKKKDIIKTVDFMKSLTNNKMLHIQENRLREDFIKYVATRKDFLGDKARLILSTNEIKFLHWYS